MCWGLGKRMHACKRQTSTPFLLADAQRESQGGRKGPLCVLSMATKTAPPRSPRLRFAWFALACFTCANGKAQACPPGQFSPAQAADCIPCGPQGYVPHEEATACLPIPAGWFGVATSTEDPLAFDHIRPCPVGHACPNGTLIPCPPGTFQARSCQGLWGPSSTPRGLALESCTDF
jgi:hypothetical protein